MTTHTTSIRSIEAAATISAHQAKPKVIIKKVNQCLTGCCHGNTAVQVASNTCFLLFFGTFSISYSTYSQHLLGFPTSPALVVAYLQKILDGYDFHIPGEEI